MVLHMKRDSGAKRKRNKGRKEGRGNIKVREGDPGHTLGFIRD